MLSSVELQQYRTQGYVIRQVLDADEVACYVDGVDAARRARDDHSRMMNLQFLQPGGEVRAVQDVICNRRVHEVVNDLLGAGEIIIDGASLFYAGTGVDYRQGWHRDVMQVPDAEIDPRWFSDDYAYNYVQVNLPLTVDACLWIVPGSHRRAFTAAESRTFGDSTKMAARDAAPLDDGINVTLQPGQAVFYNNLAVHRGHAGVLAQRRITLQMGFHSTARPPTFQFGVLDHHEYSDEYLATLAADVRAALQAHIAERQRHPQVDRYHSWHQQFIRKEFVVR